MKKKKREKKEEKEKQISTIDWQKKNTKKERPAKKSEFQRVRQKQLKNRGTHLSFSALFFRRFFMLFYFARADFFFSVFSIFFSVFFALNTSHLVETATALQNCHSRRFQYHLFFDPKYHFAVRVRQKKITNRAESN